MIVAHMLMLWLALASPASQLPAASPLQADMAISCDSCAEWNAPRKPFRLFGNTYFVGVGGLSSVLVTSPEGHVLVDGGLPQSAPLIAANISGLGFRLADVRLIVTSHAHYDHVGGVAALQRATGARVAATAASAAALEAGGPMADDPQYGFGPKENAFPAVDAVRVIGDGDVLRVGGIAITAHATPGHTPGGTSWTWRSCEGGRCVDLVYADSLTAVSAPGYRFADAGRADVLRASIARVAALPCEIVIAAHPGFTDLDGKLAARATGVRPDPFIDANGCRTYAGTAASRLDQRLNDDLKP